MLGTGKCVTVPSCVAAFTRNQEPQSPSWRQSISWLYAVRDPIFLLFKCSISVSFRLYVGSLHFNLTESDIRQVFEPFGELEFVDLHRDPMTGRSKGYAFIQSVFNFICHIFDSLFRFLIQVQTRRRCKNGLGTNGRFRIGWSHSELLFCHPVCYFGIDTSQASC